MKEPMFNVTVISGPVPVPGTKPYVQMTLSVHSTPETPDSPMAQVKMRRLEATLGSFCPADMFAVNRHLWVRWDTEDGEVRFYCRYYKERPGKVEEPWKLIVEAMKEFMEWLCNNPYLCHHKSYLLYFNSNLHSTYLI